uniref:betaine--homocysteine S-methyltransferase 1-like isoform X4 n=1 Tax=Centroberyx gerrardi TaxID=166262 RepID=UPI003AAADDCC
MAPSGKVGVNFRGILERLNAGEIVIGDGGFVFALEKRGYVKAGPWTPEAAAEYPEAVRQLHREFLRAGSNVMQTFTFYASDDKLENKYFEHVEEAEWAVQVLKETGKPVAACMCIGPDGDMHGISPGECAVRLVKAGAQIVGVNCHFDPMTCVKAVKMMKEGVEKAGLKAHYMVQPLAYHTPDCSCQGFIDLPEFPFGLEPRILSRWDMHKYAREAYNVGIRFIGGCCGFEPYHIRAVAEELAPERGYLPAASEKHGNWGAGLEMHTKPWVRARARRDYWENLRPASGRPQCPSMSAPDGWGVTKGHADLMQQKEATTQDQLKVLFEKSKTH